MKKSLLVVAIAMLSTVAFANDDSLDTQDPTANIVASGETNGFVYFVNGKILQSTCKIAADSVNKIVQLPPVQSSVFSSVGATAGETVFTLNLADCPRTYVDLETGEKRGHVGIKFTDSSNITKSGTLSNTAKSLAAQGIELQLLNSGNKVINLLDNSNNDPVQPIGAKVQILNYTARYISTGDVYAGNFETSVPFTVEYK